MQKSSQQRLVGLFSPIPAHTSQAVYFGYDAPLPFKEIRKLHYHDRYEVGICTKGKGIFICRGESKYISRGDLIFIPPTVAHFSRSLFFDEPCFCRFVFVASDTVDRFIPTEAKEQIMRIPFVMPKELYPEKCRDIQNLFELENSGICRRDQAVAMRIALLVLESRENLESAESDGGEFVNEMDSVARYLSLNCDKEISLKALSEKFHISVSQLRRNFVSAYGVSPIAYKNRLRGNMAAQLLRRSDMTVGDIAVRLGFPSGAELYRSFKKQYGVSPCEYRRSKGL
ncbi:MAG: helix-turn-helix domain-containing protein [Ruminococcaceae bacterium]|nr:helix-turn-helix domain-containing protein [Oscillospiraceae bacterium]